MLYPPSAAEAEVESFRRCDFINWYLDEAEKEESKSYLRIVANKFTV